MNAEEMFRKLGYSLIRHDDVCVVYSKVVDDYKNKKHVIFYDQTQLYDVFYDDYTKGTTQAPVDVSLPLAITQQMKELGWIDEN